MNENLKDNKLAVREFARDLHTGEIFLRLLGMHRIQAILF